MHLVFFPFIFYFPVVSLYHVEPRTLNEFSVVGVSLIMSLMVSFCAVFFPRDVLDEIWDLIESISEGFPSYSWFDCC